MRNIKLTTVTLKKRDFKEKDRIITVLSREWGKYDLIAKGVQKPGSRLSGISEPLSYGNMIVSDLKNLGTVTSCDLKESFPIIHQDLNRLSHAFYILELTDKSTAYANQTEEIFDILLGTLFMLEARADTETATRFFEHRLINALGYRINPDNCIGCGKELGGTVAYNADFGGFFCHRCNITTDRSLIFPKALLSYIKAFDTHTIKQIKDFVFPEQANRDLSKIFKKHPAYRKDKEINSLDFIITQKKDIDND
ncbi:MAG: DNA repair protein RecO [Armatimonadetes bacterium]|nr:DNA repair protein RecO [Candidatus Hippobium faecium]